MEHACEPTPCRGNRAALAPCKDNSDSLNSDDSSDHYPHNRFILKQQNRKLSSQAGWNSLPQACLCTFTCIPEQPNSLIFHHTACLFAAVVPCIFYNPFCSRFVFLCQSPRVQRLRHNAAVFDQRKARLGITASMCSLKSGPSEQSHIRL